MAASQQDLEQWAAQQGQDPEKLLVPALSGRVSNPTPEEAEEMGRRMMEAMIQSGAPVMSGRAAAEAAAAAFGTTFMDIPSDDDDNDLRHVPVEQLMNPDFLMPAHQVRRWVLGR